MDLLKQYQYTDDENLRMSEQPTVKHYTQGHHFATVVMAGGGRRSSDTKQRRM
jgi:hypothetical protein